MDLIMDLCMIFTYFNTQQQQESKQVSQCPAGSLKVLSGIGAGFGEEDIITTRVTAHQRLQVVDLGDAWHFKLLKAKCKRCLTNKQIVIYRRLKERRVIDVFDLLAL